jgi:hypothetical protein
LVTTTLLLIVFGVPCCWGIYLLFVSESSIADVFRARALRVYDALERRARADPAYLLGESELQEDPHPWTEARKGAEPPSSRGESKQFWYWVSLCLTVVAVTTIAPALVWTLTVMGMWGGEGFEAAVRTLFGVLMLLYVVFLVWAVVIAFDSGLRPVARFGPIVVHVLVLLGLFGL